jgi:predicted permease
VLGVSAAAGRLFGAGDSEQPGASPIVVLGHRLWTRRFAHSRDIVGGVVRIDGRPFTVVGVAPEGFQGTGVRTSDVWIPITMPSADGNTALFTNRAAATVIMGGRLKPGVSVDTAAAEIDAIGRALEREHPADNKDKGLRALAASPVPGNAGPIAVFLALLMGIVSTVLVVACTNVAGVLLARATARRREIAIRLAIGADRWRLVRQLLTEMLMLFALGAAAGGMVARAATSALVAALPALPFPIDMNLALDGRAIAFTTALALVAAVACGLVPALQASRIHGVAGLRDEADGPPNRSRLRHAFLVAQVALSLVLVVVAGLFVRALQHVSAASPGFDPHGVELASIDLAAAGYTDATAPLFAHDVIERVRQLPGVQAATIAAALPGGFDRISLAPIGAPGFADGGGQHLFSADWNIVEPGYFSTLKMTLVSGRDFTAADRAGTQPVAIIGAGAARRFFSGQDAVGKYVVQQPYSPPTKPPAPARRMLVVGVANDPTYGTLFDGMSDIHIYVPLQQQYLGKFTNLVVRSASGRSVSAEIRALVAATNPNVPVMAAQSAEDYTSLGLLPQRIAASVAGSLGIFGLVLAAIGINGVTASAVARRTREFGVRLALGATSRDIAGMVLRDGMRLAAAGSIVGLLLAAAAAQVLTSFLFGVAPIDPVAFAGAASLFAAVGLVACYVPARRATRVDPAITLRAE